MQFVAFVGAYSLIILCTSLQISNRQIYATLTPPVKPPSSSSSSSRAETIVTFSDEPESYLSHETVAHVTRAIENAQQLEKKWGYEANKLEASREFVQKVRVSIGPLLSFRNSVETYIDSHELSRPGLQRRAESEEVPAPLLGFSRTFLAWVAAASPASRTTSTTARTLPALVVVDRAGWIGRTIMIWIASERGLARWTHRGGRGRLP